MVFVSRERLDDDKEPDTGFLLVVPDLVAEVVSRHDGAVDLQTKVEEYLSAGVRLVWALYPDTRQVHVRRLDRSSTILNPDDKLSGEDILPGFEVTVSELFPAPLAEPGRPRRRARS
jgi:Uma2 family endonuclease